MPQRDKASPPRSSEDQKQDQAASAGQRSNAGSNYGDWRPDSKTGNPDEDESNPAARGKAGGDGSPSGPAPSTAPSGIGSKPNK